MSPLGIAYWNEEYNFFYSLFQRVNNLVVFYEGASQRNLERLVLGCQQAANRLAAVRLSVVVIGIIRTLLLRCEPRQSQSNVACTRARACPRVCARENQSALDCEAVLHEVQVRLTIQCATISVV